MKKILITGSSGYISRNLRRYIHADAMYVRDDAWKEQSFLGYDAILHAAAIVHNKKAQWENYQRVNVDLTISLARKAREDGVGQFIFLSTIAVYGDVERIDENTPIAPTTDYGKSKALAEKELRALETSNFHILIIRPPMIYGPDCPGNYQTLRKIARKTPVFPKWKNQRSVISIDNICARITEYIEDEIKGIVLPQDAEYACTVDMMQRIRLEEGLRPARESGILSVLIPLGTRFFPSIKKAFGNLIIAHTGTSKNSLP